MSNNESQISAVSMTPVESQAIPQSISETVSIKPSPVSKRLKHQVELKYRYVPSFKKRALAREEKTLPLKRRTQAQALLKKLNIVKIPLYKKYPKLPKKMK